MHGYRNLMIWFGTILCLTFVAWAGIKEGTEPVGLGTVLGAIAVNSIGIVFGRGYNKSKENGGAQ